MRLRKAIKKHKKRIIGFALLGIILAFPLSYVAAVTWDWYWFPGNPAPLSASFIIPMMIPPAITNSTFPRPDLYLAISLRANGTIAEGVEVILAATGMIASHDYYLRFYGVEIFFRDAIAWQFKNSPSLSKAIGWPQVITLNRDWKNQNDPNLVAYYNNTEIYFPVAGDYSPTVLIIFKLQPPIGYTYDDIKIHVASSFDIANAKAAKVNNLLTFALVVFAIIESVSITCYLTEDKTRPKIIISNTKTRIQRPRVPPSKRILRPK